MRRAREDLAGGRRAGPVAAALFLGLAVAAAPWSFSGRPAAPPVAFSQTQEEEGTWAQVLRLVVRQINTPGVFEIVLGPISSSEDGATRIASLEIRDRDGPWLFAEGVEIDWRASAAWRGEARFERVTAERVRVMRAPSPADDDEPGAFGGWPRPPIDVVFGRIEVAALELGPDLLGETVVGRLDGRFSDVGDVQSARLAFARVDDQPLRMAFAADRDFARGVTEATFELDEAAGGFLGRALGAPTAAALALRARATGPDDALALSLTAEATNAAALEISGRVTRTPAAVGAGEETALETAVTLEGVARPGPAAPELWRAALGETAQLALRARLRADGVWRLETLAIDSPALTLDATGAVDAPSDRIDLQLDAFAPDPTALAGLLGLDALGDARLSLRASGRLSAPTARLLLAADGVSGTFGVVAEARVEARVEPAQAPAQSPAQEPGEAEAAEAAEATLLVSLSARLDGAAFADPNLAAALGPDPRLTASGRRVQSEDGAARIALETLSLETRALSLTGAATLQLEPGASAGVAAASLNAELRAVRPFLALFGLESAGEDETAGAGALTVALSDLRWRGDQIIGLGGLRVDGRLTGLAFGDPTLSALFDGDARLDVRLVGDDGGGVRVEQGRVDMAQARLELFGTAQLPQTPEAQPTLDMAVELEIAGDGAPVRLRSVEPGPLVLGRGFLRFELVGPLDAPQMALVGELADLETPTVRIERITADGALDLRRGAEGGGFFLTIAAVGAEGSSPALQALMGPEPRFEARGRIDRARGVVTLERAEIRGSGLLAQASGALDVRGGAVALDYALEIPDLSPLEGVEGGVRVDAEISGSLEAPQLEGRLTSSRLTLGGVALDALSATLTLEDIVRAPRGTAQLSAELDGAPLTAELSVTQNNRTLAITLEEARHRTLTASGRGLLPIDADPPLSGASAVVTVAVGDLAPFQDWIGVDASGAVSATLELSPDGGWIVDATAQALVVDGVTAERLTMRLEPIDADRAELRFEIAGLADPERDWRAAAAEGALLVDLSGARLALEGRVAARGLRYRSGGPVDAAFDVNWSERALALEGTIALENAAAGGAPVRLTATLPVRAPGDPAGVGLDEAAPIAARATWAGPLAAALAAAPLSDADRDGWTASGAVAVDLALSGSASAPVLSGEATVTDGRLSMLESGLELRGLRGTAVASGGSIALEATAATGGEAGRLSLTGRFEPFAEAGAPDLFADIRLEAATLLRQDALSVTASGALSLALGGAAPRITGRLVLDEAELRLLAGGAEEPPLIDVRAIGTGAPDEAETGAARERPIALAIDLDAPRRLHARGRGLDSEWSGRLSVRGTVETPQLYGVLEAVRGQFSLAGVTFTLEDSTVRFVGPLDPILNITLRSARNGVTALVVVEGAASDPEISLQSEQDLAEDEILPQLIFGRSVSDLSAVEGAQLAAGLASLTSGRPDALDAARRLIGVDRVSIGATEDGDPILYLGRYLAEGVYLEARPGVDASDGSLAVEIEITPSIQLESEVGAEGDVGVGVQWRYDY